MMKTTMLIWLITLAFTFCPPHDLNALTVDDLFPTVVYLQREMIATIIIDGIKHEVWVKRSDEEKPKPHWVGLSGTGFLVMRNEGRFLVTAAHMDVEAQATVSSANGLPLTFKLTEFCGSSKQIPWQYHEEADLAVLALKPTKPEIRECFKRHFIGCELIMEDEEAPPRYRDLIVIGFPLKLGIKGRFSPITKESKASSGLLPLNRFDNGKEATFFLLSDPSVAGFSGAPVLYKPGSTFQKGDGLVISKSTKIVGLVHGTISDDTGGKFCAVVPSYCVLELIKQAAD
jgi:hypothetical protein